MFAQIESVKVKLLLAFTIFCIPNICRADGFEVSSATYLMPEKIAKFNVKSTGAGDLAIVVPKAETSAVIASMRVSAPVTITVKETTGDSTKNTIAVATTVTNSISLEKIITATEISVRYKYTATDKKLTCSSALLNKLGANVKWTKALVTLKDEFGIIAFQDANVASGDVIIPKDTEQLSNRTFDFGRVAYIRIGSIDTGAEKPYSITMLKDTKPQSLGIASGPIEVEENNKTSVYRFCSVAEDGSLELYGEESKQIEFTRTTPTGAPGTTSVLANTIERGRLAIAITQFTDRYALVGKTSNPVEVRIGAKSKQGYSVSSTGKPREVYLGLIRTNDAPSVLDLLSVKTDAELASRMDTLEKLQEFGPGVFETIVKVKKHYQSIKSARANVALLTARKDNLVGLLEELRTPGGAANDLDTVRLSIQEVEDQLVAARLVEPGLRVNLVRDLLWGVTENVLPAVIVRVP